MASRSRRLAWVDIACEVCGRVRSYPPGVVRQRGHIRFCSYSCARKGQTYHRTQISTGCAQCGVLIMRKPSVVSKSKTGKFYCSALCHDDARRFPPRLQKERISVTGITPVKWNDPDDVRRYHREYGAIYRERLNAQKQEWKKRNRHIVNVAQRARRTVIASSDLGSRELETLKERFGGRCLACGTNDQLELDHIVALARGGKHEATNLQLLCHSCNAKKGTMATDYRFVKGGRATRTESYRLRKKMVEVSFGIKITEVEM